ncbi:MAG: hypothetical protein AABW67_05180 [Nanoarchaeota archaeon]
MPTSHTEIENSCPIQNPVGFESKGIERNIPLCDIFLNHITLKILSRHRIMVLQWIANII